MINFIIFNCSIALINIIITLALKRNKEDEKKCMEEIKEDVENLNRYGITLFNPVLEDYYGYNLKFNMIIGLIPIINAISVFSGIIGLLSGKYILWFQDK